MLEFNARLSKARRLKYGVATGAFILAVVISGILTLVFVPFITTPNGPPETEGTPQPELEPSTQSSLQEIFFGGLMIINTVIIFIFVTQIHKQQTRSIINDIFDIYNLRRTKEYVAEISVADNKTIEISWDKKRFFVLKYNQNVLALANSSELYWKIIYWGNKLF